MSVKGSTYLYYVSQGDTLNCQLRATKALVQYIAKASGTVSPSFQSYMPCIYPVIRSTIQDARVQPNTTTFVWKYNGTTIIFDNAGLSLAFGSLAAGTFKSEVKTVDGDFAVPTLTILKDLASATNKDADQISFSGSANTGFTATVSADIEVLIEETDGEAYVGYIDVNNGGVIDDNTSSLTLNANLLVAGTLKTTGVTYQWYKMMVAGGVDTWSPISGATGRTKVIGASDIDNRELFKCVMTYSGKSAAAVMEVADETDPLVIVPNPTDGAGNQVEEVISKSQTSVVYAPFVCKRGTTTPLSGYTFSYRATSSAGVTIATATAASTFTVTKSHCETAKGGLTIFFEAS